MKKFLIAFILTSGLLLAQTKSDVGQIKTTVVSPTVWVSVPGVNGFVPAIVGSNLTVVNVGGVYTINAPTPTPPTVTFRTDFTKTGVSPAQSFSTSLPVNGGKANLDVYRNGLLQQEFEDFTAVVSGDGTVTVNFTNNVVQSGDSIKLRYVI